MSTNDLMQKNAAKETATGHRRRSWCWLAWACCLLVVLVSGLTAWAYPPSPYHLVYGTVRDEYGTPLSSSQAKVLLVTAGGVQNSTSIQPNLAIDVNYMLQVPLDTVIKPDLYRFDAQTVGVAFNMYVVIGNTTNVAIVSTSGATKLGQPTQMTRIDLYLGVDSNGDGIPDAWELEFLAAIGSNLTLGDLNAGLDLTGEGLTLMEQYLRGTYAFDRSNAFTSHILSANDGSPVLEFPTMSGKSYSVLGSLDLQQWSALSFRLVADGPTGTVRTNYSVLANQLLQVQVVKPPIVPKAQFFRIQIQ